MVAARLVHLLERPGPNPATTAAHEAGGHLAQQGFHPPAWNLLPGMAAPPNLDAEPGDTARGWQRLASRPGDERAQGMLLSALTPVSQAQLHSQAGPFAGRTFTCLPTSFDLQLPDDHFRVALLRRLRLPLPLVPRRCHCGRHLDPLGDHRAACPTSGHLAARGPALEMAVARVCCEAGGHVARASRRSSHEPGAAASSFLRSRLAAAGAVRPCRSPGPLPKHALLRPLLGFVQLRRMHGSPAGPLSLPSRHNGHWRPPCLNCPPMVPASAVTSPSYPNSWRMTAGKPRLARAVCLPPNTGWRA